MTLTNRDKRPAIAASVVVAATLLGGCSVHAQIGKLPPAVSKDKLAAVVKQRAEERAGQKADSVVCDGDLPAKVGATQRCVLTVGGDTKYGVHVTATAVNGDDVKFDAQTDDKPMN
jgi:outer membrane murein-binding lipoprotein Lpp